MSLPTCQTCIYAKGICKKTGVEIRTTTGCTYHTPKPQTKADRIRSMTDEELAELFANDWCGYCKIYNFCVANGSEAGCKGTWLVWLKEEAKE